MARKREFRLRPLGMTEILDETIELFRSNFWLLIGITAVLEIPVNLLNPARNLSKLQGGIDPTAVGGYMVGMFLWFLLYYVVVLPIEIGALTGAISERYLSRQANIVDSLKRVLNPGTLWRLLLANFWIGILFILGFVVAEVVLILMLGGIGAAGGFSDSAGPTSAMVVVGILFFFAAMVPLLWWLLATLLTPAAVLIEGLPAWQAVQRSLRLTKGMIWSIFAACLIVLIVVGILQLVLVLPFQRSMFTQMMSSGGQSVEVPFWLNMVGAIIGAVFAPLIRIVIVLFYYDARVRKEGFDLVMLAEQLDRSGGPRVAFGETSHPQERNESWRVSDEEQPVPTKVQSFDLGEPVQEEQPGEVELPTEQPAPAPEPEQPADKPKDEPT